MAWSKIKRALNSTIGTKDFKPLNEIVEDSFSEVIEEVNTRARIETGSYRGTGTYGSANPNTLVLSFNPKLIYIISEKSGGGVGFKELMLVGGCPVAHAVYRDDGSFVDDNDHYIGWDTVHVSWGENTVSWYSSNGYYGAYSQMNELNTTYYYVAIG